MSDPTIPKPQLTNGRRFWTCTWSDPRRPGERRGKGHCKRFGRCDRVGRAEAMQRYRRWLDKVYPSLKAAGEAKYSVDQLCRDYFAQMGKRYIVEGKHTTSITRIRIALDSFRAMYGDMEADAMTASRVALWVESYIGQRRVGRHVKVRKPLTKETVNLALSYIKRMYRWGAKFGRVADSAAGSVQLAENIRSDHPDVRHKPAVRPVAWETVEATINHPKGREFRDAILLLWHTGMRPGEMIVMRPCDIDVSGAVPVYTPRRHKLTHKGKSRQIPLGPKAWAIVEPLLPAKTDALVFPWRTQSKFAQRLLRRVEQIGVEHFTANQIRHAYATRIERQYGAEAVQATLGHADLHTQRFYVEKNLKRAIEVAREVG